MTRDTYNKDKQKGSVFHVYLGQSQWDKLDKAVREANASKPEYEREITKALLVRKLIEEHL